MAYENNGKKFVAVINRQQPLPIFLNALAHTAFGISGKGAEVGNLLDYRNSATCFEAKIDEYPFIILEAKNSNQLKTLTLNVVENRRIAYNVFTTSMIGMSAQAQREATLNATDESLDFVVIALFGAREDVEPLTKKFSLFKA